MSTMDTEALFDRCRTGVAELLDAGAGMRVVERAIEDCALDGDEKDALWLWASGRRHRRMSDRFGRQIVGGHARAEFVPD
jgi:hypothetical protein